VFYRMVMLPMTLGDP